MADAQIERFGGVAKGLFLFDPRRHDRGEKLFLGEHFAAGQGVAEIDRALSVMAHHPSTALHIARQLAERFLSDTPSEDLVKRMAGRLRADGHVSGMLLEMVASEEFDRSLEARLKVKEPMDYSLSLARAVCQDLPLLNVRPLEGVMRELGQLPYMHTTPDGYGAKASDWVSSAWMARSAKSAMLLASGRVPLASPPDSEPMQRCVPDNAAILRAAGPLSEQTRLAMGELSQVEQAALILASPEFLHR
jgi:uncharacterized protein (DUF1800 family)